MSSTRALIAQSHPYMVKVQAGAILDREGSKGCLPAISPHPVALEPSFRPIHEIADLFSPTTEPPYILEVPPNEQDLIRQSICISPEHGLSWHRSEMFIRQLSKVRSPVGIEVVGGGNGASLTLLCHKEDEPLVSTAFRGAFAQCALSPQAASPLASLLMSEPLDLAFLDYYTPPPYSHLLTPPDSLKTSPYESLAAALSQFIDNTAGFYQVLLQPVRATHNWHANVQALLDLEFRIKLMSGATPILNYAQQSPSGDLRGMAHEVETKAHNDKPFFAMAMRIGVLGGGDDAGKRLSSLSTFTNLFQHGGRPINTLSHNDYNGILSPGEIRTMLRLGLAHRAGFLVNSWEATGPLHIPSPADLTTHIVLHEAIEPLAPRNDALFTGTLIGTCTSAGHNLPVCVPDEIETRHGHLLGRPHTGKSTLIKSMALSKIRKGASVVVLDPYGDLAKDMLSLIPDDAVERTIYLDPGDREWVPIWNPLTPIPGQDAFRLANDLVAAIKNIVRTGWGDRLGHLLRNAFVAMTERQGYSLRDVADLLRAKSPESDRLRREILETTENEAVRRFWQNDFEGYRKDDITAPQHKLSALLLSGTVSLMLSQSESRLNLREIMDSAKVLIVNLASLASDVKQILGSFMLSLLHLSALGRADIPPEQRQPCFVYCDEAHLFLTDALENLILKTRKFALRFTLAHQCLSQFDDKKIDALSSVGWTVIFNVDSRDASFLRKDLRGLVDVDDILALKKGEAIARIDTDVVRIKTPEPLAPLERNNRDRIIAQSHALYCRPAEEVREAIHRRDAAASRRTTANSIAVPDVSATELTYAEFP